MKYLYHCCKRFLFTFTIFTSKERERESEPREWEIRDVPKNGQTIIIKQGNVLFCFFYKKMAEKFRCAIFCGLQDTDVSDVPNFEGNYQNFIKLYIIYKQSQRNSHVFKNHLLKNLSFKKLSTKYNILYFLYYLFSKLRGREEYILEVI